MRVEINLTLRCNQKCPNCNRCCNLYPDRTDDIEPGRLAEWVLSLDRGAVDRVKVVGGEPLLHPRFADCYDILLAGVRAEKIDSVKIDSNGTIPIPKVERHPLMRFSGRKPGRKEHLPYLWSPMDLGESVPTHPCRMPRVCGFSMDNRGWLPCSPAIMIVRAFGLDHLYRDTMPHNVWGVSEICRHCIHSMPRQWKDEHCKPLGEISKEEKTASPSWAKALSVLPSK